MDVPRKSAPCAARIPAFTLVEMLSVLAVIGILVAFAAPGFFNSHLSRTLSATTSNISASLDEARWKAIQKRTYTRVIFPTKPIPILESRLGRDLALGSYAIAIWDRDSNTWSLDSPWQHLPGGLGFEADDDPASLPVDVTGAAGLFVGGSTTITDIDLDRDGTPDPFEAAAITFYADGSCANSASAGQIVTSWLLTVAEGEIDPEGSFERRRPKSFRSLSINFRSGSITEIVPGS